MNNLIGRMLTKSSSKDATLLQSIIRVMLLAMGSMVLIVGCVFVLAFSALERDISTESRRQAEGATAKDLSVALSVFGDLTRKTELSVREFARRPTTIESTAKRAIDVLSNAAAEYRENPHLHYMTVVDAQGVVMAQVGSTFAPGENLSQHPALGRALKGTAVSGLWVEDERLMQRAGMASRIKVDIKTSAQSHATSRQVEKRGLVTGAAWPIEDASGKVVGAVVAGYLHNKNYELVDLLRRMLYQGMESIGTATIFLGDVRISTNVLDHTGQRAIGTLVSETIYQAVLQQGQSFKGRALVVDKWYESAYAPLRDLDDKVVGILYVGVEEEPFLKPSAAAVSKAMGRFAMYFIVATVVCVIFSLWLFLRFGRRLVGPLALLTQSASRLAQGDLDVDVPAPTTRDELGTLQLAMKNMTEGLRALVKTSRDGINSLSTSTMQISTTARQAQSTAASQATAIQEAGATIAEIRATSKVAAESAGEVVEISERALETGQRGIVSVGKAKEGLQLIGRIIDIVEMVNELAEQSNVLAVNASVEAARAGDVGKGFGVVAGEVRSLAGQSKKAARQIRDILEQIESSGSELARAHEVITDLVQVLEQASQKSRQIAGSASQQAAGMNQLGEAMEHVVRGGRDTAEGAHQLEVAVVGLNKLASELNATIKRYQVEDRSKT
jgi:methyl-accepting chemotaxis protein